MADLVPAPGASLGDAERARRDQLEAVIERGLRAWIEVGEALLEIRDSRLYRDTHPNFESYLRDRWDVGRAHGYRLIDAAQEAEAIRELSPRGDVPKTEAQARAMHSIKSMNVRAAVVAHIEAHGGWAAHTVADVRRVIADETNRWKRRQRSHHSSAAFGQLARVIAELEEGDWSLDDVNDDERLAKLDAIIATLTRVRDSLPGIEVQPEPIREDLRDHAEQAAALRDLIADHRRGLIDTAELYERAGSTRSPSRSPERGNRSATNAATARPNQAPGT